MEWLRLLRDGDVVVSAQSITQRLDLLFDTVNDSIHDEIYICRVTRNDNDTIEQNFTVSVEGEFIAVYEFVLQNRSCYHKTCPH